MIGLKIAGIMIIIVGVVSGIGYWYYNDTQERLHMLSKNNAKLETATQIQTEAIAQMEKDIKLAHELNLKTELLFADARKQVDNIRDKFNKTSELLGQRDIGTIAVAKPRPVSKIITKGTENVFRCFEIVSGAPLTEKETNAEKPSQLNSSCPGVANPNRVQQPTNFRS